MIAGGIAGLAEAGTALPQAAPVAAAAVSAAASITVARIAFLSAIAAAVASLSAVVVTTFANRALENLRFDLEERRTVRKAKLDYEYEARRRLYGECEPAVFRFIRECELARTRISLVASLHRSEALEAWLKNDESRISTIYRLFAPVAIYYQISNTLTGYDLTLAPRIHAIFGLGRLLRDCFTSDQQLASRSGDHIIPYRPGQAGAAEGDAAPAIFQHQGLTYEQLDTLTSTMLVDNSLIQLPAFVKAYNDIKSPIRKAANNVDHVVRDLDPTKLPVLWRVYLYQFAVATAIVRLMDKHPGLSDFDVGMLFDGEGEFDFAPATTQSVLPLLSVQFERLTRELRLKKGSGLGSRN